MIHIKKFVEKISIQETKKSKDVIIPLEEARGLRDEICKVLADLSDKKGTDTEEIIKIGITGGKFK